MSRLVRPAPMADYSQVFSLEESADLEGYFHSNLGWNSEENDTGTGYNLRIQNNSLSEDSPCYFLMRWTYTEKAYIPSVLQD